MQPLIHGHSKLRHCKSAIDCQHELTTAIIDSLQRLNDSLDNYSQKIDFTQFTELNNTFIQHALGFAKYSEEYAKYLNDENYQAKRTSCYLECIKNKGVNKAIQSINNGIPAKQISQQAKQLIKTAQKIFAINCQINTDEPINKLILYTNKIETKIIKFLQLVDNITINEYQQQVPQIVSQEKLFAQDCAELTKAYNALVLCAKKSTMTEISPDTTPK